MASHSYNTRSQSQLSDNPPVRESRSIPKTPTKKSATAIPQAPVKAKQSMEITTTPKKLQTAIPQAPVKAKRELFEASWNARTEGTMVTLSKIPIVVPRMFLDASHKNIMQALKSTNADNRIEMIYEIVRYPQHLPFLSEYILTVYDIDGQKQAGKAVTRAIDAWKEWYESPVYKVKNEYTHLFFQKIREACALAL